MIVIKWKYLNIFHFIASISFLFIQSIKYLHFILYIFVCRVGNGRFLVACYATLHPALSVGRSHFTFFYVFYSLTVLLLPKWSGDLKYGPCPSARVWALFIEETI